MSIRRPRTPGEILARCGTLPALAAASLVLVCVPGAALGQADDPGRVRDPMRPDRGGSDAPKVEVTDKHTVNITVKNEDIENVLELLQIESSRNIVVSKNVSGKVSATIYNATFDEALEAILYPNGWNYVVQGNFIYVFTQEEYAQRQKALIKREYKVVRLNYLNAEDAKQFVQMLLSRDGGEIQVNTPSKEFAISEKTPSGKDDFALSATLVIYDYPEHIAAVLDLLQQLDTKPQQVLVEATILQCSLNEANAFGVDFSIIADMDFTDFINVGGPLAAANSLIRGGSGAANQGVSPADNQGTAITSSPGNTSGPGTFKVGVVAGDVSVFVKMLDQVTDTVVLSNPKILALNRQPARVLVGRRVGYLSTTSTDTSTTQSVEFLDTGTQLYFRPFVSDDGNIRMELKPQVSIAEIRTVTDAGGAAVTIPDEITQELVTNVNVRDGQTVVLGGLFSEDSTFTRRQVPFLGDIPIIGAAFRGHDDSTVRSEIIFMITPSIVSDASLAYAANQAENDIERIRAGTRQQLLPWSRERMSSALNVEAERAARDGNSEKALWLSQRSLAIKPNQPQVYEIRERITSQKEAWPNTSLLDGMLGQEAEKRAARMSEVQPADEPSKYGRPWNHRKVPLEPVDGGKPGSMHSVPSRTPAPMPAPTPAMEMVEAAPADISDNAGAEPAGPDAAKSETAAAPAPMTDASNPATAAAQAPTADGQDAGIPADAIGKSTGIESRTDTTKADQASIARTKASLNSLRDQVDLLSMLNDGEVPPLGEGGNDGWQALLDRNLVAKAPVNTYVGGPNAHKIVKGEKPDAKFHTNYGWVFNPKTGQLWAAGFDGRDKPLSKTGAPAEPAPLTKGAGLDPADWASWFGFSPEQMSEFIDALETKQTTSAESDDDSK